MSYKKVVPKLVKRLPGYSLIKSDIWTATDTTIAFGLSFESSRFDRNDFKLRAVIMPLAVNGGHIAYTFSESLFPVRTRGLWKWSPEAEPTMLDDLEVKLHEAEPFLAAGRSPAAFCEWVRSTGKSYSNYLHALGYYSIYTGETAEAATLLRTVRDRLLGAEDPADWMIRRGQEVAHVLELFERDPNEARAHLDQLCQRARLALGFLDKAA